MNNALKVPPHDLTLKLDWPNEQNHLADRQAAVVQLQSANGLTVASISVPSDQLLQAVSQKLKCSVQMSPDGIVSVVSDETVKPLQAPQAITLDRLIAETISPDMLEDEPNATAMLAEFRSRLLKSLEYVDEAIASLTKD